MLFKMFNNIIHSTIGLFHTLTAILAVILGTVVLLRKKGTLTHKRTGYAYCFAMLALNSSAFFIVNFNGFSIFHFFAIVSLLTLIAGIVPAILRSKNWFRRHFYFMSWSVVGLYCAFWAEVGVRFVGNMREFWWVVALSGIITSFIGAIVINVQAKKMKFR